jgi:hypothetical protein
MPARKKYAITRRKLVPTSLIIAQQTKLYLSPENENSDTNPMNLGRVQQFKDVYDQRAFESKFSLDSMIISISTNRNIMERIKEEKMN